jgi:hypothetical protein
MSILRLEFYASCFIALMVLAGCAKNKTKFDASVDYEHDIFVEVIPAEDFK